MLELLKLIFELAFAIVGWISSLFSIVKLNCFPEIIQGIIITVVAVLSILYIRLQLSDFKNRKKARHILETEQEANAYLKQWIGTNSGHVFIYTNDMSWAENPELMKLLKKKARASNLTICLRKSTQEAQTLQEAGAKLYILSNHDEVHSRFIIVNYNDPNPRVSVYKRDDHEGFINEQYDTQSNPAVVTVFMDLAKLSVSTAAVQYVLKTEDEANKYLQKWIGTNSGHVFIYTNHMQWARTDPKLNEILLKKAKESNLTICLRSKTSEAEALKNNGANLHILSNHHSLVSRFIIVNYKDNPRVSVYQRDANDGFINEQYDMLRTPLVVKAFMDLARLAETSASE